MIEFLLYLH